MKNISYKSCKKKIFNTLLILGIITLGIIIYANLKIENCAENQLYSKENLTQIPPKKAALVLGTSKFLTNGLKNLYYQYRIEAAAELYHAKKIKYLIVSGDNTQKDYNEPEDMKNSLIELGVPAEAIYQDFAGIRTLDSVLRMEKIFGQKEYLIVSQQFHNERALYLAQHYAHKALAYNAKDVAKYAGIKTKIREYLARVKALIDIKILQTKPKYLGNEINLPE